MMVVAKVLYIVGIGILVILGWKTAEYFNRLPEAHTARPLLAWDVLVLFLSALYLVVRLVTV